MDVAAALWEMCVPMLMDVTGGNHAFLFALSLSIFALFISVVVALVCLLFVTAAAAISTAAVLFCLRAVLSTAAAAISTVAAALFCLFAFQVPGCSNVCRNCYYLLFHFVVAGFLLTVAVVFFIAAIGGNHVLLLCRCRSTR